MKPANLIHFDFYFKDISRFKAAIVEMTRANEINYCCPKKRFIISVKNIFSTWKVTQIKNWIDCSTLAAELAVASFAYWQRDLLVSAIYSS